MRLMGLGVVGIASDGLVLMLRRVNVILDCCLVSDCGGK